MDSEVNIIQYTSIFKWIFSLSKAEVLNTTSIDSALHIYNSNKLKQNYVGDYRNFNFTRDFSFCV